MADKTMKEFVIQPYIGANGITFGMTPDQVKEILGDPRRVEKNILGERDELRDGVSVTYLPGGGVVEIGLFPPARAVYKGVDLFRVDNSISALLQDDPEPFESVGFLIFLGIGVTTTGIHDKDEEQRAVTVFSQGRWDHARKRLKPWRAH